MHKIERVVAAALAGVVVSAATAQDAVQWRIEDGGNGHWYALVEIPLPFSIESSETAATAVGGYAASITSVVENEFVESQWGNRGLLGLFANAGDSTFYWSSGEPVTYSNWGTGSCPSGPYPNNPSTAERLVYQHCSAGGLPAWDDLQASELNNGALELILEWSADCNDDGIVDYGQILNGTFADENGDGVPDCCEPAYCVGDLNGDDAIGPPDLGILLALWNTDGSPNGADINDDGTVNAADLGLLIGAWGDCGCN